MANFSADEYFLDIGYSYEDFSKENSIMAWLFGQISFVL